MTDENNPLLEDNVESDEAEEEEQTESADAEYTAAEQQIAAMMDEGEGRRRGQCYVNPSDACDFCGCNLQERAFFVDGRLPGQITFASMCAECFLENGEGVGWGKGQIYKKTPEGGWLMVAGFPPKEQQ